jgi:hypothetical protein
MIINPFLLSIDVSTQIRLGADVIPCYKKLKNLIDQDLTWDNQVNKIGRNVFYTLSRLWHMADFTPVETRRKLVTSLIVPLFYYCDIIFCRSSMRLRERLKLAFNSCARDIYSISRFRHISPFVNMILEVPLDTYYSFRVCCNVATSHTCTPLHISTTCNLNKQTLYEILYNISITPSNKVTLCTCRTT